jgi:uncharacterized protein YkwD
VLEGVNAHRSSEGLAPLASRAALAEIARSHSRDMAAGRVAFGHAGFKARGEAVAARIPYERFAENVSRHRRRFDEIARTAVESWIGSRSHRENIEGPFLLTGVGAARSDDGGVYLTQLFVRPR